MRSIPLLLTDILAALRSIQSRIQALDFSQFERDEQLRDSIYWQLAVAGEAAIELLKTHPDLRVDLPDLVRLGAVRNRIIHGYFSIDAQRVWSIARENVPPLADAVNEWLQNYQPESDE